MADARVTQTGVALRDGENLSAKMEVDFLGTDHPSSKFKKFFDTLLGTKDEGYIVITNQRIIEIHSLSICGARITQSERHVLLSSVKEVGYGREMACCCCCDELQFYYQAHAQTTRVRVCGLEEKQLQQVVDYAFEAIDKANK